jgi:uncharacterized protein YbbK (DUF523 family)
MTALAILNFDVLKRVCGPEVANGLRVPRDKAADGTLDRTKRVKKSYESKVKTAYTFR